MPRTTKEMNGTLQIGNFHLGGVSKNPVILHKHNQSFVKTFLYIWKIRVLLNFIFTLPFFRTYQIQSHALLIVVRQQNP